MKEQLIRKIEEKRETIQFFDQPTLRGTRFNNNNGILDKIRMDVFERLKLKQLPTIEQALMIIPEEDQERYISRALFIAAKSDYHYAEKQKK